MTKYSPISDFLEGQVADRLPLDFQKLEKVLGASLPRSAFKHQAWWANDPSHSQGKAWLEAGWKTEGLDLSRRIVTFRRLAKQPPPAGASDARPAPDPWGALAGTVTIHDEGALTSPAGEVWDAESA